MSLFSPIVTEFWRTQFANAALFHGDTTFTIAVNPELEEGSRVMVLKTTDGRGAAVLTPTMADRLGLAAGHDLTEATFRRKLAEAGVILNGADFVFYFSDGARQALTQEKPEAGVGQLTDQDGAIFSAFQSSASEQDLDDADVELDHWAVFGSFDDGRLVCAASMYPWEDAPIADTGVLTLPSYRGKGHARKVVRAISRYACEQGYEPQYRCQTDNLASVALAKTAGLTLFGTWEVISPDSPD